MSSRQEEKERRRREREEKQQAEKAAAARRKRLQMVFGVVLAVLVLGGRPRWSLGRALGGGDSGEPREAPAGGADIPARAGGRPQEGRRGRRLQARRRAERGRRPRGEGLQGLRLQAEPAHLRQPLPAVVRGRHLRAGRHAGARQARPHARARPDRHPVQEGHAGDHGRASSRRSTTRWTAATTCCCSRTAPNMPFAVAATAWDHQLGCPTMNPKVFDAIRAFRDEYIDKGPGSRPVGASLASRRSRLDRGRDR